jgi:putative sugar O-methyltransferase
MIKFSMDSLRFRVETQDYYFRVRNRIRRFVARKSVFNSADGLSDSQASFYVEQVRKLLGDEALLSNFRRKYDYREILEHVSFSLGKQYLDLIELSMPNSYNQLLLENLRNDSFGNPYRYKYSERLCISPTTLRYIYTAIDIERTLGLGRNESVVEIGVGYGGQAAVLESLYKVSNYDAFDLPEVISLANVYLKKINSKIHFDSRDIHIAQDKVWDIVISNYAFSELNKDLQIRYLDTILRKTSRGYMIMNSGRLNVSGRSTSKLSVNEIAEFLPTMRIKEEYPLTGPDNYVIYWGV